MLFFYTTPQPCDSWRGNKLTQSTLTYRLYLPSLLLTPSKKTPLSTPTPSLLHPPSSSQTSTLPFFIFWALSLTAGSDYGCEKWGSHASNPPLQHSCSMTPHFLPTKAGPVSASLSVSLPPSLLFMHPSAFLCLSSALRSWLLFCCSNTEQSKEDKGGKVCAGLCLFEGTCVLQ